MRARATKRVRSCSARPSRCTGLFWRISLLRSASLLGALLAFLVGRFNHRHTTIDVLWGAGFLVIYLECTRIARAGYGHLHAVITAPSARSGGCASRSIWPVASAGPKTNALIQFEKQPWR